MSETPPPAVNNTSNATTDASAEEWSKGSAPALAVIMMSVVAVTAVVVVLVVVVNAWRQRRAAKARLHLIPVYRGGEDDDWETELLDASRAPDDPKYGSQRTRLSFARV